MKKYPTLSKIFLLPLVFLLCFCFEKGPDIDYGELDIAPRHLRVIWTERPSSHAIISWTTLLEPGDSHMVYFDTLSHSDSPVNEFLFQTAALKNGELTLHKDDRKTGVPKGYYHHAELRNLKPNTRYYFRVQSGENLSDEYYFITAPADDRSFSLIWGGDSRMGGKEYAPHTARQNMNKRIKTLLDENPDILAFNHGADYDQTADWRHLYWWFEDHQMIVGDDNRLLPMIISRGNHDSAEGFTENFWLGDIDDYYYETHLSKGVTLLTLNTEISIAGNQRDWIEKSLSTNRLNKRWVLVNYHQPGYPAVKDFEGHHATAIRQNWVPLFEANNIDLALESDGHILKRTVPIRNDREDPSGIVYIGEGGLGVPQRKADTTRWFIKNPGFAKSADNVHLIHFSQDSLVATAYAMNGEILDHYTRAPRNND